MFNTTYFAGAYFAPEYWGGGTTPTTPVGGPYWSSAFDGSDYWAADYWGSAPGSTPAPSAFNFTDPYEAYLIVS